MELNLQVSLVIKATTAGELETGHVVLTPLGAAGGYSAADVLILTTRRFTLVGQGKGTAGVFITFTGLQNFCCCSL